MTSKEYIEKEAAIRNVCKGCGLFDTDNCICTGSIRCDEYDAILNIPPADVKPVVQGKWEKIEIHYCGRYTIVSMRCSECKRYHNEVYFYGNPVENVHFCSYCGAGMRKETNDENS